jgi:hypothetical protein
MAQPFIFQGSHPRARQGARRRTDGFFRRLGTWLEEWRRILRHVRAEAEINRKLSAYDEHLLRDMGLVRVGDRIEPSDPERSPWR